MKPFAKKSYGSIGHLPGSRMEAQHTKYATGKSIGKDFGVGGGVARICLEKCRPGDTVIVQEKLDGSNVAVVNADGVLHAISRSGHACVSSPHMQHRLFAQWIIDNAALFEFLRPGERVVGEWLAQAHGTRYALRHAPFVAFDLIDDTKRGVSSDDPTGCRIPRATYGVFRERCGHLVTPCLLHSGAACSVERAISLLDPKHHGAIDPIEGCVWRVEREGRVDIIAKYVRPDKVDGKYLPEVSGGEIVWNS